jgi:hypothetical protein
MQRLAIHNDETALQNALVRRKISRAAAGRKNDPNLWAQSSWKRMPLIGQIHLPFGAIGGMVN